MAAGRQKKRLISSSVTRFSSLEQQRDTNSSSSSSKKKKSYQLPDHVWNLRPHVALEWDDACSSAVARKDQVGMSWRDLSPFLEEPPPQPRSGLADVLSVPEGIFGLEDLSGVLSYEVWKRCLSDSDRKFLTRFLPEGSDADDVVRSLLEGENLHFGNPFEKWGSSLCSGHSHPDLILKRKKNIKDMKKFYYSGLRKYHDQIIESLLQWREIWTSCKNPEKEIVEKLWRKGMTTTSSLSPGASDRVKTINTSRKMTPESCFSSEDDTRYMSYFKVSKRHHEMIKKEGHSGDGIPSKVLNNTIGDIKYLNLQPYVKLEEEERRNQHKHWLMLAYNDLPIAYELFSQKGVLIKQWRNNIAQELPKIEDVKNYTSDCVKDEESNDVLEFSTTEKDNTVHYLSDEGLHRNVSSYNLHNEKNRLERIPSLNTSHEFEVVDDGRNQDNTTTTTVDPTQDRLQLDGKTKDTMKPSSIRNNESATYHLPENMHQNENISSYHVEVDHLVRIPSLNTHHEVETLDVDHDMTQDSAATQVNAPLNRLKLIEALNLANNSDQGTPISNAVLERLPSLNSPQDAKTVALLEEDSKDTDYTESRSSGGPLFFGNIKEATDIVNTDGTGCSAGEMWTEDSIMSSFCGSSSQRSHMYNSNDNVSHNQTQTVSPNINIETNTLVGHTSDSMPSLAAENGSPFFNQYQHHSMLLPTFSKEQTMLPTYSNEHLDSLKRSDLPFLARNGPLHLSSSSSHHIQGREIMLEHGHAREKEHYLHLMAGNSQYSNLCQAPAGGAQDWFSYSHANGGLTGQAMFPSELRSPNSWSGVGPLGSVSHCPDNGRNTDGSLYSVLPEYNKGIPSYPCNTTLSHLSHTSSYLGNEIYQNSNLPSNRFSYGMIPGQLSHLNSREATATAAPLKAGGLHWMNYSHQNPSVNDLIGKSYLRSWNQ